MKSCVVFQYNPTIGWQVFDYYPKSLADVPTLVKVLHDNAGKPSLLMLHGTFKSDIRIIRKRFTKQPHKLLESLA